MSTMYTAACLRKHDCLKTRFDGNTNKRFTTKEKEFNVIPRQASVLDMLGDLTNYEIGFLVLRNLITGLFRIEKPINLLNKQCSKK
jgi:hypothetical protein